MVPVKYPNLFVTNQEITNNAVAASNLSGPLCSIIEVSARRARKKTKKQNTVHRIQDTEFETPRYTVRSTQHDERIKNAV